MTATAVAPTPAAPHQNTKVALPIVFSHQNIITTYFWIGEPASADNGSIPNAASAWDGSWQTHYGGIDDPAHRQGYWPAAFRPKENPFYVALPYSDITDAGLRKVSATNCTPYSPQASQHAYSWCKNTWVAIRHGGKVAYAQWEDVGPFDEDDLTYVFGNAQPSNHKGARAGLDVSPAVKDYLGLTDVDSCDWSFVQLRQVPTGPWQEIETSSLGDSVTGSNT